MFVIDLIERKVGDIEAKVIPLDNIFPEDLDWIKSLPGGMTEEIYNQTYHINRMRNCDSHLINIDTVRVLVVKECILLWAILQGNIKKRPQMDQLCSWLNETKHTHKGELMLREREVHEPGKHVGPEVLFGENLEDALKTTPGGGETVAPELASEHYGDSMSNEDMEAMFERNSIEVAVEDGPEILLTEVIPGDSTELMDEIEIEIILDEVFGSNLKSETDPLLTEEAM
ncbi:hypothetical protein LCGC14_2281990 [marine sediment metagenome]|uniref:Uncharacterized protein n=1 Tax=marine sediment metagenome TaxID=412755 RepID=A0A0F9DG88_9ZZZZ